MVTVAMAFPDGRGGQAGRCPHASGTHFPKLADPKRLEKSWVRTYPRKNLFFALGGLPVFISPIACCLAFSRSGAVFFVPGKTTGTPLANSSSVNLWPSTFTART